MNSCLLWSCLGCPLEVTTAAGCDGGGGGVYLVLGSSLSRSLSRSLSLPLEEVLAETETAAGAAESSRPSQPTFLGQSHVCSS